MFDKLKAKAQSRKEEELRQAEERRKAEIDRLSQLTEKEILIEIRMLLGGLDQRVTALEDEVGSISSEVNQLRLDGLLKG